MKYAGILRAICLVAILNTAGCAGQAFDSPITTQSGLAFMSSKRIYNDHFSELNPSLTERSDEKSEPKPADAGTMDDCPSNQMDPNNVDIE